MTAEGERSQALRYHTHPVCVYFGYAIWYYIDAPINYVSFKSDLHKRRAISCDLSPSAVMW